MNTEIERKFLVKDQSFKTQAKEVKHLVQGYLCLEKNRTVRVRIAQDKAYLTIKGKTSENGLTRYEWEKEIEVADAQELLKLCEGGVIDKNRYIVDYKGFIFEVDEFFGDNEGLIVAELELKSEDESFLVPEWIKQEVTGQNKYYNSQLMITPFKNW